MIQTKAWGVKEVITSVMLSLLGVALLFAGSMLTMVNTYLMLFFSGGMGVLLAAPVYMLLIARVNRFGTTAIFTGCLSLMFLSYGGFFAMFIPIYIVLGLLLEYLFLRKEANRRAPKKLSLVWIVFSVCYLLSTFVSFIDIDNYIQLVRAQRGDAMANTFLNIYTNPLWVIVIVLLTILAAYIGTRIGTALINRHFKKAGVL